MAQALAEAGFLVIVGARSFWEKKVAGRWQLPLNVTNEESIDPLNLRPMGLRFRQAAALPDDKGESSGEEGLSFSKERPYRNIYHIPVVSFCRDVI